MAECVALIARDVADSCRFARLQALLSTVGATREPWLLSNFEPDAGSLQRLRQSNAQLRVARQANITDWKWRVFGGKLINYSKAAFLLWLLGEGRHCEKAWQIEDDVFYTGQWSLLFDAHAAQRSEDLLAPMAPVSTNWSFGAHCILAPQVSCRDARGDGQLIRVEWPLLRISQRLAGEVSHVLQTGGGHGFHEAILEPICARAKWGCVSAQLNVSHIGRLMGGHIGGVPRTAQTLEMLALDQRRGQAPANSSAASIPAGKVYHPVKCEADERLGAKAERWARAAADGTAT